jgi:hypothetical protein
MNEDSGKGRNLFFRIPSQGDLFQEYLQDAEFIDMGTKARQDFDRFWPLTKKNL